MATKTAAAAAPLDKSDNAVTKKSNQNTTAVLRTNNTGKDIKSAIPRER